MTVSDNLSAIEKADRCKFSTYGYACGKHVEHGRYLCEEHATAKCASCGQPATHGCDFCGQFVCGTPLCNECTFGTDTSKSAGAWGFMNHIHISRPEFADKHDNRRLKEEIAALSRKAEALTGIGSAQDLIADWLGEGTDDLPDETPVRIEIGKRTIISDTLGSLRRARTLLNGGSDAQE